MLNVNLPSRGLGLLPGNGTLLPSFGIGLGPVVPSVGGAFYAEPDRHLKKEIQDLELSKRLIEDQILDRLKAKEHAKPAPKPTKPKEIVFDIEAARRLARESEEVSRLVSGLKEVENEIRALEHRLAEIGEEEDLIDLLLLQ